MPHHHQMRKTNNASRIPIHSRVYLLFPDGPHSQTTTPIHPPGISSTTIQRHARFKFPEDGSFTWYFCLDDTKTACGVRSDKFSYGDIGGFFSWPKGCSVAILRRWPGQPWTVQYLKVCEINRTFTGKSYLSHTWRCGRLFTDSMVDCVGDGQGWWRAFFVLRFAFWYWDSDVSDGSNAKKYALRLPPTDSRDVRSERPSSKISYNSNTSDATYHRFAPMCSNANCKHDGSYEGHWLRDAVKKKSYNDSLNKRRTTMTRVDVVENSTNNRRLSRAPLHCSFVR